MKTRNGRETTSGQATELARELCTGKTSAIVAATVQLSTATQAPRRKLADAAEVAPTLVGLTPRRWTSRPAVSGSPVLPWNWPSFRSVPVAGSQKTWLTLRGFAPALITGQIGFGYAAPLSWRMLPARNTTHFVDDPPDIYSGRLGNPETLAWNNCSTKWRWVQSRVGTVTPIAPLSPAVAQSPIALLSVRQLDGIRHANP